MRPSALLVLLVLLVALALQSCIVVRGAVGVVVVGPFVALDALTREPAPTVDAPESMELAQRVTGTLVVADGSGTLTFVSLPSRETTRVHVGGWAIAASGPDEDGRVVYVRSVWGIWEWLFMCGDVRHELYELRLPEGTRRRIAVLDRGRSNSPRTLRIARRGGLAAYDDGKRPPQVFDLEHDTRTCTNPDAADFEGRYDARLFKFDAGPRPALTTDDDTEAMGRGLSAILRHNDDGADDQGTVAGRALVIGDGLAIYEGFATPASKPRAHFSLMWPGFDRSLRLGDWRTHETLTLVPRYYGDNFDFMPVELPRD